LAYLRIVKKDRIYIDTSIVGGYFDLEFEAETKLLFKRLTNREIVFVVSDLLDLELERAPERVRNLLFDFQMTALNDARSIKKPWSWVSGIYRKMSWAEPA
jgi:ABC-type Na+ transport system ATPase subunit NatA